MYGMDRVYGYTLIEMLVVLILIGIATAAGAVGFSSVVSDSQIETTVNNLHQGLMLARNTAISRGQLVTVCPLTATGQCGKDWSKPVSVFMDPTDARALTQPKRLIDVISHAKPVELEVRPAWKRYFQFSPVGLVHGALGSVLVCAKKPATDNAVYLSVSMGGRVRELWDKDGDGRIRTAYGATFSCTTGS